MRKKTIAIFFIIGVVLAAIGGAVYGAGVAAAVSSATVNADGTVTGISAGLGGLALVGVLLLVVGGVASLISWVGALVAVAKQSRWGWFVCILIFGGIAELVYLIAGPALPTAGMQGGYAAPNM